MISALSTTPSGAPWAPPWRPSQRPDTNKNPRLGKPVQARQPLRGRQAPGRAAGAAADGGPANRASWSTAFLLRFARAATAFRTDLQWKNARFYMFFCMFWAVPLNTKNGAEAPPRLFSCFLGALKSGVTRHQNGEEGHRAFFVAVFAQL